MSIISLIAVVDEAWGLGKDNRLLCHLPADLKRFKQLTLGKPVVMGRNTFDSIGRPLPERLNIVLSRQVLRIKGVMVFDGLRKALDFINDAPEVMIIGGAGIYKQSLSIATRIYLTRIHHQFEADVYFPKIEEATWEMKESSYHPRDENNKYDMTFFCYEKSLKNN